MIDLDEAERIGKAAWSGEWIVDQDPRHDGADQIVCGELTVCFMSTPIEHSEPNSAFIAYARNHWQEMVDEIRRLRRSLAEETQRADRWIEQARMVE